MTESSNQQDRTDSSFETSKVYSGVRWTSVGQVVLQAVRFLVSIVLARLLVPADFGLAAMAFVVTGFLAIIQYLGTGGVVIQRKELPQSLLDSLFLLNCIFGCLLATGLLLLAPLLASLYDNVEVIPLIRVCAISCVITAFGAVPGALLNREMKFASLTKISFVSSGVSAVSGVGLAFAGAGVWALVLSSLFSSVVTTTLQWIASGWRPRLQFDWLAIKPNWKMMWNLTWMNVINYFTMDYDKFAIGKWMDEIRVGYYSMAGRFCLYPVLTIAPILSRVLYPAYSRIQDDDAAIGKMMLRSAGGIAFITLPLMVGISCVSGPFVTAVLGENWLPVIPLIILLAPVGIFQSIAAGSSGVLLAKDKTHWLLWIAIARAAFTIAAIMIGMMWDLSGVAIAYSIATVISTWTVYAIALRMIGQSLWTLILSLRPYVVLNAIMAAFVLFARYLLEGIGLSPAIVLGSCIALGVIVYVAASLILLPPAVKDVAKILPTKVQMRLPASLTA